VNPAGVNPAGVNPAGVNPAGVNPAGVNPAGVNPAGVNPAGVNPAGVRPRPRPVITRPSGTNPTGTNPTGTNPTGTNPTGTNPTGTNPTGTNPTGTNPTGTNPGVTTVPATARALTLSEPQNRVASAMYGANARIMDVDNDGKVNSGDVIQKADGSKITLDRVSAAEFNQRTNLVNVGMSNPAWRFNASPTPALYDNSGRPVRSNQFWEIGTFRDGTGKESEYLKLRPGVDPSAAVEDMRANAKNYGFDCATAIRAANLVATKDTVGDAAFNANHQNLWVYSLRDSQKLDASGQPSNNAGMSDIQLTRDAVWHADPNGPTSRTYQKDGRSVTERGGWELDRYQANNPNDKLMPGDWRYYERGGDVTSANQGWNTIYLGENPPGSGNHQFWHIGAKFNDRSPGQTGTGMEGEYLGAARRTVDAQRIAAMGGR
jgi:hypothetical protein